MTGQDRSRSPAGDATRLEWISRALCSMGRYPAKRPPGLWVDKTGAFSMKALMSTWGQAHNLDEGTVMQAVKRHMFHEDGGTLRFAVDCGEDGEVLIRVQPRRSDRGRHGRGGGGWDWSAAGGDCATPSRPQRGEAYGGGAGEGRWVKRRGSARDMVAMWKGARHGQHESAATPPSSSGGGGGGGTGRGGEALTREERLNMSLDRVIKAQHASEPSAGGGEPYSKLTAREKLDMPLEEVIRVDAAPSRPQEAWLRLRPAGELFQATPPQQGDRAPRPAQEAGHGGEDSRPHHGGGGGSGGGGGHDDSWHNWQQPWPRDGGADHFNWPRDGGDRAASPEKVQARHRRRGHRGGKSSNGASNFSERRTRVQQACKQMGWTEETKHVRLTVRGSAREDAHWLSKGSGGYSNGWWEERRHDAPPSAGEQVQRWLSWALQAGHHDLGIKVTEGGAAHLQELALAMPKRFGEFDADRLKALLEESDVSGRFAISPDGLIRKVPRESRCRRGAPGGARGRSRSRSISSSPPLGVEDRRRRGRGLSSASSSCSISPPRAGEPMECSSTGILEARSGNAATPSAELRPRAGAVGTATGSPAPPPGEHWTQYKDGPTLWWHYDGPLGEWWCAEGDRVPHPYSAEDQGE